MSSILTGKNATSIQTKRKKSAAYRKPIAQVTIKSNWAESRVSFGMHGRRSQALHQLNYASYNRCKNAKTMGRPKAASKWRHAVQMQTISLCPQQQERLKRFLTNFNVPPIEAAAGGGGGFGEPKRQATRGKGRGSRSRSNSQRVAWETVRQVKGKGSSQVSGLLSLSSFSQFPRSPA